MLALLGWLCVGAAVLLMLYFLWRMAPPVAQFYWLCYYDDGPDGETIREWVESLRK